MKKLIAFDLDDTINVTKLPIDTDMAMLLASLLDKIKVCIISGSDWKVMKNNIILQLTRLNRKLNWENLYIMPTTGTQLWYYVGNSIQNLNENQIIENGWKREYFYCLSDEQIKKTTFAIEMASKVLGYWCENPNGDVIENRGSQVTFSALGQWANPKDKHEWDPKMEKRSSIVKMITPNLANLGVEISIGGATSIDVTLPGIDKGFGILKLKNETNLNKEDILFIGDKLQLGGNDYPVKKMKFDTIEVTCAEDTKWILRGILGFIK